MRSAHVSSTPLDFVGVSPAPAPALGVRIRAGSEPTARTARRRSSLGTLAEQALYVGLSAGFLTMVYGLGTLLH